MNRIFAFFSLLVASSISLGACTESEANPTSTAGDSEKPTSNPAGAKTSDPAKPNAGKPANDEWTLIHIRNTDQFLDFIEKLPWQEVAVGKVGALTLSEDAIADDDLELDGERVRPPAQRPAGCRESWPCYANFRESPFPRGASKSPSISSEPADDEGRVPGVTYGEPLGEIRLTSTWGHISVAKGTKFRMRKVIETFPVVDVERDSTVPCDQGERRCAASKTCFAEGFNTCAYCDESPAEVCECLDAAGPLADGTHCVVGVSGSMSGGSCLAGICQTD